MINLRRPVFVAVCVCLIITAAQVNPQTPDPLVQTGSDPCPGIMNVDVCFASGTTSGSGSTSGCLYCYTTSYAPYGNCFSGAAGLPYPLVANCRGGQMCWKDASGATLCQPVCFGNPCLLV